MVLPGDEPLTRQEWERVPSDLDLRNDPVYGLFEMEIHEINKDRLVFPPKDGDMTRKAVLIVI